MSKNDTIFAVATTLAVFIMITALVSMQTIPAFVTFVQANITLTTNQTGNQTSNQTGNQSIETLTPEQPVTIPNLNTTNKSTIPNTTLPEQMPPESVNGSNVGKI
jgi:hypothetical protein